MGLGDQLSPTLEILISFGQLWIMSYSTGLYFTQGSLSRVTVVDNLSGMDVNTRKIALRRL